MATRSYIIAKVPKEMIGTQIKFDASKLPVKIGEMDWHTHTVIEQKAVPRTPIRLTHEYIRIYHHNDGYPTGLGAYLLKHYNSLDAALNLIAGGPCSSCINHYMGWAEYHNSLEDYVDDLWQSDCPEPDESYSYLFADGKWKYYNYKYDKMKRPHDLERAVKRMQKIESTQ